MKAGDTFYLRKGMPGDPLYKCHVVAVVDECMVVYKWYGRRKQWWHYEVEDEEILCRTLNSSSQGPALKTNKTKNRKAENF